MIQVTDLPLGEWMPAAPTFQNPGCGVADNVIPIAGGYRPQLAPVASGIVTDDETPVPISGACLGATALFARNGTTITLGGTSTTLFTIRGGQAVRTTGLAAVPSGGAWDFAQFNNIAVATNGAAVPQYLDNIESDDSWSALPGSPPVAKYCQRVEDFLMLGNITNFPNRIQWSPFNAPAGTWGTVRLTQAGFADLPLAFGAVQRIVGGRFPMVFQERGVSRLEYIGPPVVWRVTEVSQDRGTIAPFSVVTTGFLTAFLAQDGFWLTDGSEFRPIGAGRVNQWFFDTARADLLTDVHGVPDWENECFVWAFKAAATGFDRLIRYNWAQNQWSSATVNVSRLVNAVAGAFTLDQIAALFPSIEDVTPPLDNPRWLGRQRLLGAFIDGATTTDLHLFRGAPLAARFETGEFQPAPGQRAFVSGARALGDGVQGWRLGARAYANNRAPSDTPLAAHGVGGWAPLRTDGMGIQMIAACDAGVNWSKITGIQPRFRASGAR